MFQSAERFFSFIIFNAYFINFDLSSSSYLLFAKMEFELLLFFQNIVGADSAKNTRVVFQGEGKTVIAGNSPFPDMLKALYFLYPERRMIKIIAKHF